MIGRFNSVQMATLKYASAEVAQQPLKSRPHNRNMERPCNACVRQAAGKIFFDCRMCACTRDPDSRTSNTLRHTLQSSIPRMHAGYWQSTLSTLRRNASHAIFRMTLPSDFQTLRDQVGQRGQLCIIDEIELLDCVHEMGKAKLEMGIAIFSNDFHAMTMGEMRKDSK